MQDWQRQFGESFSSLRELLDFLQLAPDALPVDEAACQSFPLRVPRPFAARIKRGDAADPLLRQVLPLSHEQMTVPGYVTDPLQEQAAHPVPGLLHKYFGRVLLVLTGACAINCRYCFRRHFPYNESALSASRQQGMIEYLVAHPEVYEVILSGGDPLVLKDQRLQRLVEQLESIVSLQYLRIHTRLPIMLPSRITDDLLSVLSNSRFKVTLVLHCNHAQEIDVAVEKALAKLAAAGVTLLNQSVLLNGVNDDADILIALSHRLYQSGVLPYYLHALDAVEGAAHFAVDESRALQFMQQMQKKLPGFLVPKLVREVANAVSKVQISDGF